MEVDEEDGKRLGIEPYKDPKGEVFYFFSVEPPQVIAGQVKGKFGTLRLVQPINKPYLLELNGASVNIVDIL